MSSGIFYLCEADRVDADHRAYREDLQAFQSKYNVSATDLREIVQLLGGTELDQYENFSTAETVGPWGYKFPDLYTSFSSFAIITTIGYGKMAPVSVGGKVWLIICIFLGVPTTAWALSAFSKAILGWLDNHERFLGIPLGTLGANEAQIAFDHADKNRNTHLSRSEVRYPEYLRCFSKFWTEILKS